MVFRKKHYDCRYHAARPIDKGDERSIFHIHGKDDDLKRALYVEKRKSGKKNVVVWDRCMIMSEWRRTQKIYTFYDHPKGSVYVVDLIFSNFSTRIKSKRWPLNNLAFIIDTARANANTILIESNVKMSTHEFTYQLARTLCLPSIQSLYDSSNGIRVKQIKRVLSINKEVHPIENKEQTGHCYVCVANILGTPSYISKRKKLNSKLKVTCHLCNQILCKDHYYYILCHNCKNE